MPTELSAMAAMEAPTPASAYLHSSTMVKAGVYLLARLSPALGGTETWTWWLTVVGVLTLLTGALMASAQVYLKRLLAYTTVAALGFMVMLLGVGSAAAVQAAVVFLMAHACYKASLFLVAPADPAHFAIADRQLPLPPDVPGLVVASRNDPWMSFERAEYWSRQWQVPLFDAGEVGHINAQSGHGEWSQGLNLLNTLHHRAEMVVDPVSTEWDRRAALSFR